LIMYPFPHYQQLIFSRSCSAREKGRKSKTSKMVALEEHVRLCLGITFPMIVKLI